MNRSWSFADRTIAVRVAGNGERRTVRPLGLTGTVLVAVKLTVVMRRVAWLY